MLGIFPKDIGCMGNNVTRKGFLGSGVHHLPSSCCIGWGEELVGLISSQLEFHACNAKQTSAAKAELSLESSGSAVTHTFDEQLLDLSCIN